MGGHLDTLSREGSLDEVIFEERMRRFGDKYFRGVSKLKDWEL